MEQLAGMIQSISVLYNIPLWLVGLMFVVLMLVAVESGYRVGMLRRAQLGVADGEVGGGGVVLTAMFALLGLIIAFTYASAANRYESRKQAVIEEANALGTAFLRANLIAEPGRSEVKWALYNYALTRVPDPHRTGRDTSGIFTEQERLEAFRLTLTALNDIWPITERIVLSTEKPGAIEASLVAAINHVLDVHTVRIAAIFDKLPGAVVWMLVVIAGSSLSVAGYNAGVTGFISRWRMTIFSFVLAGVMLVIVDFDRPTNGLVRVSRAHVQMVIDDMGRDLGVQRGSLNSS